MNLRTQELCRQLKPVLGKKVDRLWSAYLAESDPGGRADIEQTLELLAAKHLGKSYEPDRSPFPPPPKKFAVAGDIHMGSVTYGGHAFYPFNLPSDRLKEHLLIAGRSGSGKTNLTFILVEAIMARGIKILALDWKRGYRDVKSHQKHLLVYTIGRDISPFRFNPLIPPAGCEPHLWIKLIVDVIAGSYLGGEGVISLLVSGLDHLYLQCGVFDQSQTGWPTIHDLLVWLRSVKLKGRAAMWQASAERILLGMTYGEFGAVLNAQNNNHVADLLNHNVVLEMDGLSSASDRVMFSEALTLYLYRYRLACGPQKKLTNVVVLEEAHNLLLKKSTEAKESVLETSIRMVRQYGMGYIFIDQSASLLSKVAYANSYATIALSQKLRSDVQTIAGSMNLNDEQKQALNTLPIGTAVVRLADQYPEPFLVKVPLSSIREGCITDNDIRTGSSSSSTNPKPNRVISSNQEVITPIPPPDNNKENNRNNSENKSKESHPPSPKESQDMDISSNSKPGPPRKLSPEERQFLIDIVTHSLSTTVSRYHRLHLSRRRGNAVRESLESTGLIDRCTIATRSGQVVLYQLTDRGKETCLSLNIDPGAQCNETLEHRYWIEKTAKQFAGDGYTIKYEHPVRGNQAIDIFASRVDEKVAIEIETGKSDIKANLEKIRGRDFNQIILVATSPTAVTACQRAIADTPMNGKQVELRTWLDIS